MSSRTPPAPPAPQAPQAPNADRAGETPAREAASGAPLQQRLLRRRLLSASHDPASVIGSATSVELQELLDQGLACLRDDFLGPAPAGRGGSLSPVVPLTSVGRTARGSEPASRLAAARSYTDRVRHAVQQHAVQVLLDVPDALWSPLLRAVVHDHHRALEERPGEEDAPAAGPGAPEPWERGGRWPFLAPLAARARTLHLGSRELLARQLSELPPASRREGGAHLTLLGLVSAPWDAELALAALRHAGPDGMLAVARALALNPSVDDAVWQAVEALALTLALRQGETEMLAVLDWAERPQTPERLTQVVRYVLSSNLRREPDRPLLGLLAHPAVRQDPRVVAHLTMLDAVAHPVLRALVRPELLASAWQELRATGRDYEAVQLWENMDRRHAAALGEAQWEAALTDPAWAASLERHDTAGALLQALDPATVAQWSADTVARLLAGAPRAVRLHLVRLRAGPSVPAARTPSGSGRAR